MERCWVATWTRGPRPWGPQSQPSRCHTGVCVHVFALVHICVRKRARSPAYFVPTSVSALVAGVSPLPAVPASFPWPTAGTCRCDGVCARSGSPLQSSRALPAHLWDHRGQPRASVSEGIVFLATPTPPGMPPALSLPVTAAWPPFSARHESCFLSLPRGSEAHGGSPPSFSTPRGPQGGPGPGEIAVCTNVRARIALPVFKLARDAQA